MHFSQFQLGDLSHGSGRRQDAIEIDFGDLTVIDQLHCDDPIEPVFYAIRKLLLVYDSGAFSPGVVKDRLQRCRRRTLKSREQELKRYCADNNASVSEFPAPHESLQPKYAIKDSKGSKFFNTASQFYLSAEVAVCFSLLLSLSIILLEILSKPLHTLAFALLALSFIHLYRRIKYMLSFDRLFTGTTAMLVEDRLSGVLRSLKQIGDSQPWECHTHFSRSRRHPHVRAFSVEVVSQVMVPELNNFPLTVRMHIVGDSLREPLLIVWWYEYPYSLFLSEQKIRAIRRIDRVLARWTRENVRQTVPNVASIGRRIRWTNLSEATWDPCSDTKSIGLRTA